MITLMRKTSQPTDEEFLDSQLHVHAAVPFRLRNVGTGPALMARWRFLKESEEEGVAGMIPYIRTDQRVSTQLSKEQLGFQRMCGTFPGITLTSPGSCKCRLLAD